MKARSSLVTVAIMNNIAAITPAFTHHGCIPSAELGDSGALS
jgi:hypothetical protein